MARKKRSIQLSERTEGKRGREGVEEGPRASSELSSTSHHQPYPLSCYFLAALENGSKAVR